MSGNQVGRRTADGGKSKNNMSTPQWGGHNTLQTLTFYHSYEIPNGKSLTSKKTKRSKFYVHKLVFPPQAQEAYTS